VKWHGYTEADNTWEPIENLQDVKDEIEDYEKRTSEKALRDSRKNLSKSENIKSPQRLIGKKRTAQSQEEEDELDIVENQNRSPINIDDDLDGEYVEEIVELSPKNKNSAKISSYPNKQNKNNSQTQSQGQNPLSNEGRPSSRASLRNPRMTSPPKNTNSSKKTEKKSPVYLTREKLNKVETVDKALSELQKREQKINSSKASSTNDIPEEQNTYKSVVKGKENFVNKMAENDGSDSSKYDGESGKFETDKPIRILDAKQHEDKHQELLCKIDWKKRGDGIKPLASWHTNAEIKDYCPMLLCEYYEERLKFPAHKR